MIRGELPLTFQVALTVDLIFPVRGQRPTVYHAAYRPFPEDLPM